MYVVLLSLIFGGVVWLLLLLWIECFVSNAVIKAEELAIMDICEVMAC